jgi:hypothetical protein
MADLPSRAQLETALAAADAAHREYERGALKGVADELWSGFVAAYVIGRLGEFAPPSRLAALIEEVEASTDWPAAAADHLLTKLRS